MDIERKKLNLMQWLAQLNNEQLLKKVEAVQAEDIDFWDELSEPQKEEIKKGLGELDSNLKHDYNQVVAPFK